MQHDGGMLIVVPPLSFCGVVFSSHDVIGKKKMYWEATEVHDLAREARAALRRILDEKVFAIKYGDKAEDCMAGRVAKVGTYAFDMALFFHPLHADLAFVDTMVDLMSGDDADKKGESVS